MFGEIFIDIPCSNSFVQEMAESGEQCKEMYDIIVKAFMFKRKFELSKESGSYLKVKQFDLNDVKVFNGFIDECVDKILDNAARKYVLETIRQIRDNNFRKKSVKTTYETMYELLNPNSYRLKNMKGVLGNSLKLIDFCYIFKKCNKTPLTKDSPEIKSIYMTYDAIMEMTMNEMSIFN